MTDESRKHRLKRIGKVILFSLTPAVLIAAVIESAAIVSISRQGRVMVDSATQRSTYVWRMGLWPWSRQAYTPLNSLGFPDDEFPTVQDPKECSHVVFAGDSFIFGDGVDRDSNAASIVRRHLAARPTRPCLRVFNIAERGTTIDRQMARILATLDRLRPDVVILTQYQNDLTDLKAPGAILGPPPPDGARGGRVPVPRAAFNISTVKLLAYHSTAFMIERGIRRDQLSVWSVMADSSRRGEARQLKNTYARLFAGLVDTLQRRGVAFGVIMIPSKLDVLASRFPEESFFIELAERHGVPYLRTFPVFDTRRRPYAFLMYDGHLNEHGNRLLAENILQWMWRSEPAPFPVVRSAVAAGQEPDGAVK